MNFVDVIPFPLCLGPQSPASHMRRGGVLPAPCVNLPCSRTLRQPAGFPRQLSSRRWRTLWKATPRLPGAYPERKRCTTEVTFSVHCSRGYYFDTATIILQREGEERRVGATNKRNKIRRHHSDYGEWCE